MGLHVRWLGRVPYGEALDLQRGLFEQGDDNHLLLLEHPPVYTLGVRAERVYRDRFALERVVEALRGLRDPAP